MARLLLLALLASLTACTSLGPPPETPAPVEDRDVPGSTPPATVQPERPVVGPPLPPDFDPNRSTPQTPATPSPAASLLTQVDSAIAAGQLDRAAALAERAIRIAPRDAQAWYSLANVQFRQRRYPDAQGSAQRALSFARGNAQLERAINALLTNIRNAQ
ncbi:MAG: tetratricopeptide repeat protein [Pseudomonadota bacterium]|nr:tetratricopeptide repeat protein [Pseudomonadota bacterium]